MDKILWSGHVSIIEGADGKTRIVYRADADAADFTYTPDGYFENKAVNGLVKKFTFAAQRSIYQGRRCRRCGSWKAAGP